MISKGIKSFIIEDNLKIVILENKIDIVNYLDIGSFDSTKIIVKTDSKDVIIKGKNLVVSKLMSNEVLITGEFNTIEFR